MTQNIHAQRLLVLDFGSQYTQLIARRLREIGVYCEIHPFDADAEVLKNFAPKGVILSGGPESTLGGDTPKAPDWLFESDLPILGICYGMQTMALQLGGDVIASKQQEFGYAEVKVDAPCVLLEGLSDSDLGLLDVWMSHGDKVSALPPGFNAVATTDTTPFAAMAHQSKPWFGVQFHPEVTHTKQGGEILRRFIAEVCGCEALWTADNIAEDAIETVREQVGSDHVLLGLSGGVDSSVVAALLHKAIGDQLTCVFVDNGLLRLHEGDQVMAMFAEHMGVKVIRVNAQQRFLDAMAGVSDPEAKRKIIGNVFIDVFEEESNKIENVKWLAQGTIYPDVIESASTKKGKSHVIKSHHNVGGLPDYMKLGLVEPLRELFKDEVRRLGVALGLPHDMVYRHPFPGPGLGVRILGEVTQQYADILREADHIFISELRSADLYHSISQAFVVFQPIKSVGVVGDARRYAYVVALRAVETIDFMTARWAHIPYDVLERVSNRIMNEIADIARVTYDISSKPPATIEWE